MKKDIFKLKGVSGDCYFDFDKFDTRDGLKVYAALTKYRNKDIDAADIDTIEASLLKIADIALKYLYINNNRVQDIAGLEVESDGTNLAILTNIVEKFLEVYTDFLE